MQQHMAMTISGKVQGVFFRASVKAEAERLGVTGFVRNEPNGNVYLEAEGEEAALRQLSAWCAHGPRLARVTSVQTETGTVKHFHTFVITS